MTTPNPSLQERIKAISVDHWLEIIGTIVLSVAAVAVAWCGYQSARWSGIQQATYSQAAQRRVQAARASTNAGQDEHKDLIDFNFFIEAEVKEDKELINFYIKRFRAEFATVFDAWLKTDPINNPNAPASPFDMPQYQDPKRLRADRLEREADELFAKGNAANDRSDEYILTSVTLALALFFAGIAPRFKWVWARVIITAAGFLILVSALLTLVLNPII